MSFWVGADPGGEGKFGACILDASGSTVTFVGDCADDVVEWLEESLEAPPSGVGIDAPMWGSSAAAGSRYADTWLRSAFDMGSTVFSVNSLPGSVLNQGSMFLFRLRERFAELPGTETHPKGLLKAFGFTRDKFFEQFGIRCDSASEHEHDAAIAAVAAREGFEGRWSLDLAQQRFDSEQDPNQYWLAPVHYYWPDL